MRFLFFLLVGLFTQGLLFSQTVPAGVGTNNIIWLEANDLTGPLSDNFTWADKTTNNFDAVEVAGGAVPTLVTIGANQYLRFAGSAGEQLVIPDDNGSTNLLDNSNEFSVIAVFNTGLTDTRALISKRLNSSNRSWTMFYNTGFNMYGYAGSTTVGGTGSVASAGNPYIAIMTVDAALSGSSVKMFVNSSAAGSTGSNVAIPDRSEDVIIGEFNSGDGRYFDGDIAEIIVYRDALNDGERIILENYLGEKYGVSISNDYFGNYVSYNTAYNDDLKGVGTGDGTTLHASSGFSSGLQLTALSGLDNTNEFVLFTHDATVAHADGITSNITDPQITNRWQKDYYVEASQAGVVDAASVQMEFRFDFSQAGLTFSGASTDYVLLYRASTADDFTRVFAYSYALENSDQIVVSIPSSQLQSGYYTLGRGTQLTSRTWYVLQNGNWNDPTTWTLDAGTAPVPNNPLSEIPGVNDDVVIRNGKTVTIQPTTNNLSLTSITVDGTLDVTTSTGHNFNSINGQGTIKISGNGGVSNFPSGSTVSSDGFANPANGGLVIVEGIGLEFDQNETFKDLRIQTTNATDIVSLGADMTLNGNLTVRFGTFQMGDGTGTSRTLTIVGDVAVENNGGTQDGRFTTAFAAASNARHELNLYGDFLNEGTTQFSDRTTPDYTNESLNGVVDFNLISTTQDQRIDCNGPTYFYRMEINKGSTDFTADIQANSPTNFVLTGYANFSTAGDIAVPADNPNAFGLITGTASIGTNVSVRLNITGNYSIGSNAKLLISGGEVTKTGGAAITPYGVIEVASGILEVPSGSGITTRDNGQINVTGGALWACQIRTSVQGASAQGGYLQTGGTVNVWAYSALESPVLGVAAGTANASYARFCLTYEGNAFTMTGGTLNVKDATTSGLIFINSDASNINVTGGLVNAYSSTTGSSIIASNASFANLELYQDNTGTISIETLTCGPGGPDNRTITNPDLIVLSDLRIRTGTELVMNNNDLYIGEDFTIDENITGSTYQPGTNTTYFNGTLSGQVTLNSTQPNRSSGRLEYFNVVLDKPANKSLFHVYNLPNFSGNVIQVNGDMTIESGIWNQGAEDILLQGFNLTNKGVLGVYEPGVYDGIIVFRNDPINLITTDGAQFGYVKDNNRFTITLSSDVYIQRLRWRRGLWYLGANNLKIDRLDIRPNTNSTGADYVDEDGTTVCQNCLSANYMFATDGNASDGGLSLMIPSNGINEAILRSDNGDPTRDIFDYRGNVVANTTGGGPGDNLFIFPIGVGASGIDAEFGDPSGLTTADTAKYTPIYMNIQDVTGVMEDSVYVTVRPVDAVLQTTDLTGGDALSYYWRVSHAYSGTTPSVTFDMDYYTVDLDGSVNEATFVAGEVLDGGSYTRSYEDDNVPENEFVVAANNRMTFNGDTDLGFSLSNTNYTAGENGRFVGAPQIFYTRTPGDGFTIKWDNGNNWTFAPNDIDGNTVVDDYELHDSRQPAAGDFPQVGDVAVIGWVPYGDPGGTDGDPHGIAVDGITASFAEIRFTQMEDISGNPTARQYAYNFQFRPTVVINDAGGALNGSRILGEGMFWMRWGASQADPSFSGIDIGDFISQDSAYLVYESKSGVYNNVPAEVPNLLIAGNGWGAIDQDFELATDLRVRGNLELLGDVNLILSAGASGDIIVDNDLRIFRNNANGNDSGGFGRIDYPNAASRSIEVLGDLRLENEQAIVRVASPDVTQNISQLIVHGDIVQDVTSNGGLQLYTASNEDCVQLTLTGSGKNSFNLISGATPTLYNIIMNKGTDTTSTFTIGTNFILPTPTDIGIQPIEIVNGLLILDDPGVNITLADGTQGNFYLPNTLNPQATSGSGGLELRSGNAKIVGDDIGIVLDGLLRISGGTLDMSDDQGGTTNGNNFIQYGASDEAVIDITSGSLLIGSQVRRTITTSSGLLNYSQTGGIARFGINAAPEPTRGVFEVLGSGSSFTHTAGEFTVVRQNGSTTVGSLIIKPLPGDLNVIGSTITIGSASTPINQNDIGIDSDVVLNNLLITGNNNLTAKIYNVQLEVGGVTIESGATFDENGYDLTVNGDLTNDGTLTNGGTAINQQTTYFPSSGAQTISGTGTTNIYNLAKTGSGTLTVSSDITVGNNLNLLNGTMATGTSSVSVKGDMVLDAIHTSSNVGPGIVFNGTGVQNLNTTTDTGEFGVVTIDNANGVQIPGDGRIFQVNDKMILSSGIFNIGGNLLIMNENAIFENGVGGNARTDFNVNSMISVNASITDNGVRKIYNDAYAGTYLYPVGLNYYTPAEVNVTSITGGNAGEITIKPIEDIAGGIPDDADETCNGADYVDVDNILQFYWLIRSSNVTDFDGSIFLYHVDQLESVNNAQGLDLTNYAPARLLDNSSTWDKGYGAAQFDEVNNVSQFNVIGGGDYTNFTSSDIAGTYTAGIYVQSNSNTPLCGGAIPDVVPEYITLSTGSGDVDALGSYATAPGGTPPTLGESPDLRVAGNFTLNLTNQFWRFRRVVIESGATLTISGAGVNLGTVTGDGTLKLINTNTLPAGDYASFEADAGCTTGGGFELEVTTGNSVDLALPFNRLRRLILSGDGEKVVTNGTTYNICENLEILNSGTLTLSDNTTININGNLIKSATATFDGDYTNARMVMNGSTQQQIDGNFTGLESIRSLEVDNSAGLTIVNAANDSVEVDQLVMTNGKITTDQNNSLIILNTGDVTGNFGSNTFVDGPLIRRLETSTSTNFFPVGDGTVYLPFEISNTLGYTGTKDWTVTYHDEDPGTSPRITNVNATYDFTTWNAEQNTINSTLFRQDLFEVDVVSPATADVRPYWDGDSNVGPSQTEWQNLRVMVWSDINQTWESYGNNNANYSGMSTSSGSVISDTDLSFSTKFVTLGSNAAVPLPVELLYFKGKLLDNQVVLNWETISEVNNNYFEILHSLDGIAFEAIAKVEGNGNTNKAITYSFTHHKPAAGDNYYRLRQVDFDGKSELHEIIRIYNDHYQTSDVALSLVIYPNPASSENINLEIVSGDDHTPIYVSIFDLQGKVYYRSLLEGSMKLDEKVTPNTQMIPGVYYIILQQGNNFSKQKLIIK